MERKLNIVWFKRDLRLQDHEPLTKACQLNVPVCCLHIIEPALWEQPDFSARQYQFYLECLTDLLVECQSKKSLFV